MNQGDEGVARYVGRAVERATALAALRAGTGVLVRGDPGTGRTRFLREVAHQLGEGFPLWIGHDVDRLDDDRAARLAKAVRAHEIVPLASTDSGRSLSPQLDRLRTEAGVVVVELGPLTARELLAVVEGHLGGALAAASVPTLVPAAGGIHVGSLVRALEAATGSGSLTRTEGGWDLATPMPPSESIRGLVFTRTGTDLRTESPDTVTILDLLGLAPGLRTTVLLRILDRVGVPTAGAEITLEGLEESRMLTAGADDPADPSLSIRDGIDERLIVLAIGRLRRSRLATAIGEVLAEADAATLSPGELVALAKYGLQRGEPLAQDTLIRAARASLRTPDAAQSLRIASAAVEAGGGFDAELTVAAAEAQAGLADAALARLARTAVEAGDDVQRTDALQAMIRHVRESATQAVQIIDDESLDQLALSAARRDLLRGLMLYTLGDVVPAAGLIASAIPELTGLELAEAHFHVGAVNLILGHIERAGEDLDAAEAAYAAVGADASNVHMVRAHVNTLRGRIRDSLPVVRAIREAAGAFGQPIAQGMCGWAIGNLLLSSGSVSEALQEFRATIRILDEAELGRTRALVSLDLALGLALSGDPVAALDALPWSTPDAHGAGAGVSGKFLQVQGWIHASAGRADQAREAFIRSADRHASGGFRLPSLAALIDAARVGQASAVIDRIEELADDMDGEYIDLVVRFARALAAQDHQDHHDHQDPAAAPGLAAEFDAIGAAATVFDLHIEAAEAHDHAAGLHRAAGEAREAAASERMRDARIAHCGLTRLPLVRAAAASLLSDREHELARLAASGLSNREIAERLVLSVRTVETHLLTVYRKLGVRGRAQLSEALSLRPAEPSLDTGIQAPNGHKRTGRRE